MQPNIVLITADQFRGDCLGIMGHPDVKTPYLDTLAAQGAYFTNMYSACPSCIPARAALMTGMLRSQDIPCKLVVGYAGQAYHAWISVWSAETGWIDGAIYFNGSSWQRMDPTFASSAKSSKAIMAYIGDGKNYSAKYFY